MDTIRLILPQLLWFFFVVAVILIGAHFLNKEIKDDEFKKVVKKARFYLLILTAIYFSIWIISLTSVNNVPRSVIDRSGLTDQKQSFQSYTDSVNNTKPKSTK